MKHCSLLAVLTFCAGMMAGTAVTVAQPSLTFIRIVNNWPTVELYFKVACDGQPVYPTGKQFYKVYENGFEVGEYTLWCPDPRQRCAISVALVFDASGSMQNGGNAGAKAAGNAFVDLMDGVIDEAVLIWFNNAVNIELDMTTNKTDLHDAVNALPASGGTAVWDGMYVGLQELISSGSNPCRAVIAMTDGGDNASSHTPDEIIALANRNRIRVFTIGLGSVTPTQLETIALLTGGKYYQALSPEQLVATYEEISTIMFGGFLECMITYETSCADGGIRTVDLFLRDFCNGGSDRKTRTYRAPHDTTTYTDMDITLGEGSSMQGREVPLPLRFDLPVQGPVILYNSTFTFKFDENCVNFNRFDTPPGTMLNGNSVKVEYIAGGVKVIVEDRLFVQSGGTLGFAYFTPATNPADSITCPVELASWQFQQGCFQPVLHDGEVIVYNSDIPFVVVEGPRDICEGESVRLTAADGFSDYLWSTGETTKSIWVSKAGNYSVTAKNGAGQTNGSNIVTISMLPIPTPGISQSGVVAICRGSTITVFANPGYEQYEWSTGETTDSLVITKAGTYSYKAQIPNGCWGESPKLQVQYKGPQPVISGDDVVCGKDVFAEYSVTHNNGQQYTWSVNGGRLLTDADSSAVRIWFTTSAQATVSVEVFDPITGCRVIQSKMVTVFTGPDQVNVDRETVLCPGDTARLWVDPRFTSYEWSTGATGNEIRIAAPGEYFCQVTNGPCTFYTDTVRITEKQNVQLSITGDINVCQNGTGMYSAPQIEGMSYRWRLEGESTDARSGNPVTLQFAGGQSARVILHYGPVGCPDSASLDVTLIEGVKPAVAIEPDSIVCEGDSIMLTAADGFTDYRWSNGQTTQSIVVTESGTYSVSAMGPNGCRGTSIGHSIAVVPNPPNPVLRVIGNEIGCNAPGYDYRWYIDGNLIPGATTMSIQLQGPGMYVVELINTDGCSSFSDPFVISSIGNYAPGLASAFSIAPNPSSGDFTVALEFERPTAFSMRIVNTAGQVVYSRTMHEQRTSYHGSISLDGASAGVYFLILESAGMYDFRKVIVRPY